MTAHVAEDIVAAQPLPGFGEPEEVSEMVLFPATEATYSTGSEFIVDGGALLGPVIGGPEE